MRWDERILLDVKPPLPVKQHKSIHPDVSHPRGHQTRMRCRYIFPLKNGNRSCMGIWGGYLYDSGRMLGYITLRTHAFLSVRDKVLYSRRRERKKALW